MKLRVLAEAEAEIEAARAYLNEQSRGLGGRFLEDLGDTFDKVAARPLSFPMLETIPDDLPYRRALLGTFRYAAVFEVLADEIVVVAVVHTSRAPNYWIDRSS
ncbi:MAG: type II toxin-antitoxin system RelE/ParE family toxin [Planctomycetales bacterium]